VLNEFKNGGHFGEMALLKTNARTRGATIVTKQKTTLAVLKLKDFKKICKIYPEFFESIQKTNKER
jgi:CRP-like cAMP-binding protein